VTLLRQQQVAAGRTRHRAGVVGRPRSRLSVGEDCCVAKQQRAVRDRGSTRRFDSGAAGVAGAAGVVVLALVAAFAIVAGLAVTDGVPAEDYDAGNRFAFAVLALLLVAACRWSRSPYSPACGFRTAGCGAPFSPARFLT
jgi:hypothetical protein